MKKMVKRFTGDILDVSLTGVTLGQVGSTFTGSLSGIGNATQSILATGTLVRTGKRHKLL